MQSPRPDGDAGAACACGRSVSDAAFSTYRSQTAVFTFRRCDCGREWTERRDGYDPSQPISTDEVIEVHQLLRRFRGSISEMFALPSA